MENNLKINRIRTIILCKGLQASGKSTWAIKQMVKYPGKYKRSNRDLLRDLVDNNKYTPENEKFIVDLRDTIVERSLMRGFDVIIDDTNFNDSNWFSMCEIAKRVGNVRVMEKYFSVTLKEALKRNPLKSPEMKSLH